jgi:bacterial/archaeal transporter family protein
VKNILLLILLVTTQVLGDIWLSQGMKIFGEVTSFAPDYLIELIGYLFLSPWIWLGVATLTFSMVLYLIAISRLDVSYVLPIHASSYVLNAFMAWLLLHEQVSVTRWFATAIVGLGVFVVSSSETKIFNSNKAKKYKKPNFSFLFLLPYTLHLPKIWLGILMLSLCDSAGDVLTARGMKQVGKSFPKSLLQGMAWLGQVFTHPYILSGVACYTISFLTFISLLSWADISLVRPATAIGYANSMIGARYILQERISRARLIGIIIIGLGVTIISFS